MNKNNIIFIVTVTDIIIIMRTRLSGRPAGCPILIILRLNPNPVQLQPLSPAKKEFALQVTGPRLRQDDV